MKQREILFLLGSICVVVFVWIAFTILHNSLTSTISDTTSQAIQPISATFDTKIIGVMKNKLEVNPAFTIETTPGANKVISQTTITPSPLATGSATIASTSGGFQ